jgi:ABC-type nitrate/sulfonate/bicarbonate transport system substrate-binding protein
MVSHRYLLAVLSASLALFLCQCGEKQSNPELKPVDFHIDWVPGGDYSGFYLAQERGFYQKPGNLNLSITPGQGAEESTRLISVGRIQIGTTTVDAILNQARSTTDATIDLQQLPRIAAVIFQKNPCVIVSRSNLSIDNLESLKGKILGFSEVTSVDYRQFVALWRSTYHQDPITETLDDIKKKQRDANNVTMVQVGYDGPQYLLSGDIDATLTYSTDAPVELSLRNFEYKVRYLSDLGVAVAGMAIAVPPKPQLDRDAIKAVVQASVDGWEEVRANPKKAAELMSVRFPELDRSRLQFSIERSVQLLPPMGDLKSYAGFDVLNKLLQQSDAVVKKQLGDSRSLDTRLLIYPSD